MISDELAWIWAAIAGMTVIPFILHIILDIWDGIEDRKLMRNLISIFESKE